MEFGEQIIKLKKDIPAKIIEIDELHTYIKKTIVGSGLLLIELGKDSSIVFLGAEAQKQEKIMTIN